MFNQQDKFMMDTAPLILTLITAMILGLITGAIAEKKGHSFVTWWAFGVVFFIVALPVALLMDSKKPTEQGFARNSGMKFCPYCSTAIKTSVMKCPECKRSQPNIGAATSESWQRARVAGDDVEKWAKEHGLEKDKDEAG